MGELAAGRGAAWMDDGRSPEIRFEWSGQDGVAVNGCIVFVPLGPRRLWKPPPAPTSGDAEPLRGPRAAGAGHRPGQPTASAEPLRTSRSSLLKAFRWESGLAHQAHSPLIRVASQAL
ncbi:hypothetical protein ACGFZG_22825 [Streptomyces antibioticus]|uniref:hypothetical protein n=1 Tax=Streptomyces antibioticus TaxID=1890 RepID=UPI0036FC3DD9